MTSFRDIYDENFDFVWRSLRRLGVSEADVADAAQEVFVVVHRKLSEFEARSKITTWLFGICLRVASDRRRRSSARHEVLLGGDDRVMEHIADDTAAPDRNAERREQALLIDRVLDALPIDQRTVFILFELEELSGDEIATMLEIPPGTVHSRLRLAREAFRTAVARHHARDQFRVSGGVRP